MRKLKKYIKKNVKKTEKINKTQKGGTIYIFSAIRKVKLARKNNKLPFKLGTISDNTSIYPTNYPTNYVTIVLDDNKIEVILDLDTIDTFIDLFKTIEKLLKDRGYDVYLYHLYNISVKITNDHFNKDKLNKQNIRIISIEKLHTEQDFMKYIIEDINIKKISAKKPVATFDSSANGLGIGLAGSITTFYYNWNKTSDTIHRKILESLNQILKKNGVSNCQIYVSESNVFNSVIFYSVEHLQYLCDLFGYNIMEGLKIISEPVHETKKLAFIYISFGDKYKDYDTGILEFFNKDENSEFKKLFEEYNKYFSIMN